MRRLYQRAFERRKKTNSMSHILSVGMLLVFAYCLLLIFTIVTLDSRSFDEFWCSFDAIDPPLIYLLPLLLLSVLYLIWLDWFSNSLSGQAVGRGRRTYYLGTVVLVTGMLFIAFQQYDQFGMLNRCKPKVGLEGPIPLEKYSAIQRYVLQYRACADPHVRLTPAFCSGFDRRLGDRCESDGLDFWCYWRAFDESLSSSS